MKHIDWFSILLTLVAGMMLTMSCNSCRSRKSSTVQPEAYQQQSPAFNADSAYIYVEEQVAYGPRVPGTTAHELCGDYLVNKLTAYGAKVVQQRAMVTHYDGRELPLRNIVGSYGLEQEKRVLLFAHWDSRPFADEESDPLRRNQPILGADDGASGVGVLLEVARQLQLQPLEIGVDIIFFDLEDWGVPSFERQQWEGDWWCVGSRYWAEQPHQEDYRAEYGILLDMVGSANATFLKEGYSQQYAHNIVDKVWSTAHKLGFGHFFPVQQGGYITDDHLPVNQMKRAPSINIINLKRDTDTGFGSHWHTLSDDMRNIDRNSLKAVGQTVLELIYTDK